MNYFIHNGSSGDMVYALPAIMELGGGMIYTKEKFYNLMKPVLEAQTYIKEVQIFKDFPIKRSIKNFDVSFESNGRIIKNLDRYRITEQQAAKEGKIKHLADHHLEIFGLKTDLNKKWLFNIEMLPITPIVINRTTRYHDRELIDWKLLKPYKEHILFIGKRSEYKQFEKILGYRVQYYKCNDALEMAQIIKGSKLFIGNQSLAFALAEGMKQTRVLEVCYERDNCRPNGNNGHIMLSNKLLEGIWSK